MFASIFIIVVSLALFVYWLRHTCVELILSQSAWAATFNPAVQGTFSFAEVQERLNAGGELNPLRKLLQRDYEVLMYLTRHASGLQLESFEEKLLFWDYKAMRCWYALTRTAAPEQARQALAEMASVLNVLAGRIGQRAGLATEA
jgi:hypothetical protein